MLITIASFPGLVAAFAMERGLGALSLLGGEPGWFVDIAVPHGSGRCGCFLVLYSKVFDAAGWAF